MGVDWPNGNACGVHRVRKEKRIERGKNKVSAKKLTPQADAELKAMLDEVDAPAPGLDLVDQIKKLKEELLEHCRALEARKTISTGPLFRKVREWKSLEEKLERAK